MYNAFEGHVMCFSNEFDGRDINMTILIDIDDSPLTKPSHIKEGMPCTVKMIH